MTTEMPWNPRDWYWIVGNNETRLWSSARSAYVPANDEALAAWLERGGSICRADTLENIWRTTGKPFAPRDYLADKRWRTETGGVEIDGHIYETDRDSQPKFTAAVVMSQLDPQATFQWKCRDAFVTLDAAQMVTAAQGVGAFVQSCFDLEAALVAEIEAGTITTADEIDAADWPANG